VDTLQRIAGIWRQDNLPNQSLLARSLQHLVELLPIPIRVFLHQLLDQPLARQPALLLLPRPAHQMQLDYLLHLVNLPHSPGAISALHYPHTSLARAARKCC
jgi:hypothetical protein